MKKVKGNNQQSESDILTLCKSSFLKKKKKIKNKTVTKN